MLPHRGTIFNKTIVYLGLVLCFRQQADPRESPEWWLLLREDEVEEELGVAALEATAGAVEAAALDDTEAARYSGMGIGEGAVNEIGCCWWWW